MALASLFGIALTGCSGAGATPPVIYVTPAPTLTPLVIYVTPEPTPTPAATEAPAPTSEPSREPTPTPAPAPTSPAAGCTGTAAHQAFFADAARNLSFAVYCAALPKGWWLQNAGYERPNGGTLGIYYKNSSGGEINMAEGNLCPTGPCPVSGTALGPASFGGMAATLYLMSSSPPIYGVVAGWGSVPTYAMVGRGMTQSQLVAWAAGLVRVRRA